MYTFFVCRFVESYLSLTDEEMESMAQFGKIFAATKTMGNQDLIYIYLICFESRGICLKEFLFELACLEGWKFLNWGILQRRDRSHMEYFSRFDFLG